MTITQALPVMLRIVPTGWDPPPACFEGSPRHRAVHAWDFIRGRFKNNLSEKLSCRIRVSRHGMKFRAGRAVDTMLSSAVASHATRFSKSGPSLRTPAANRATA